MTYRIIARSNSGHWQTVSHTPYFNIQARGDAEELLESQLVRAGGVYDPVTRSGYYYGDDGRLNQLMIAGLQ